jgi:hypothetical protein
MIGGAGETDHRKAIGETGDRAFCFERLAANGCEEDAVKREGVGCSGSYSQVTAMDGIERAAKESHAHSDYSSSASAGGLGLPG